MATCATTSTVRDREAVRSVMSPAAPRSDAASGGRIGAHRGQDADEQPPRSRTAPARRTTTRSPGETSSAAACSAGKNEGSTSAVHAAKIMAERRGREREDRGLGQQLPQQARAARAERAPHGNLSRARRRRARAAGWRRWRRRAAARGRRRPSGPLATIATCARCSGSMRVAGITANGRGSFGRSSVPRLLAGYSRASCPASVASCACASASDTPSRNCPRTASPRSPRPPCRPGSSGVHTSIGRPASMPVKRGGATPTIVNACPFSIIVVPIGRRLGREGAPPERVADHGRRRRRRFRVGRDDRPPVRRPDAERVEVLAGDARDADALRDRRRPAASSGAESSIAASVANAVVSDLNER